MIRRVGQAILALVLAVFVYAALGLTWAHIAVRQEHAALPPPAAVRDAVRGADGPIRVAVINTASQAMPRSAVLDGRDPHPAAPYVMSHPSFVLEWADGRILLVDTGMTRDGALRFGRPIEWLGGASPIQPLTAAAERLGDRRSRVQAVIFTHLHVDHTGGIGALCASSPQPIRVFMTDAQAERTNFTTRPGRQLVRAAGCVHEERLRGSGLLPVPEFPGVWVIAAGGHTPGSQIVFAAVHDTEPPRLIAFVGDIVNNVEGITYDVPKPFLYRLLMVPEADGRQRELRQYLRALHTDLGVQLLAAHDQLAIEAAGIPAF